MKVRFPFNDTALIINRGATDVHGQSVETKTTEVMFTLLSTISTPILTSTGQDVSATRGRAGDETSVSEGLVPLGTVVAKGDTVVFSPAKRGEGITTVVQSVEIKKSVRSRPSFLILRLFHGLDEGSDTTPADTGNGAPSGW